MSDIYTLIEQHLKTQTEDEERTWWGADELAKYFRISKGHARTLIYKYMPHKLIDGEQKVKLAWVLSNESYFEKEFLWDIRHGFADEALSVPAQHYKEA